jgi:hypothetical protein
VEEYLNYSEAIIAKATLDLEDAKAKNIPFQDSMTQ